MQNNSLTLVSKKVLAVQQLALSSIIIPMGTLTADRKIPKAARTYGRNLLISDSSQIDLSDIQQDPTRSDKIRQDPTRSDKIRQDPTRSDKIRQDLTRFL